MEKKVALATRPLVGAAARWEAGHWIQTENVTAALSEILGLASSGGEKSGQDWGLPRKERLVERGIRGLSGRREKRLKGVGGTYLSWCGELTPAQRLRKKGREQLEKSLSEGGATRRSMPRGGGLECFELKKKRQRVFGNAAEDRRRSKNNPIGGGNRKCESNAGTTRRLKKKIQDDARDFEGTPLERRGRVYGKN